MNVARIQVRGVAAIAPKLANWKAPAMRSNQLAALTIAARLAVADAS
jgi:hypothetical protein